MLFEIATDQHVWMVAYDKAIRDDGTLFFPERLTREFLAEQRKVLGSYIFANQYLNEILPNGEQDFKQEWFKYYTEKPKNVYTFAFIDPAISLQDGADYTAAVVVHVDADGFWYIEVAKRQRINATDTIQLMFDIHSQYNTMCIGVEIVAYQEALLHFLDEEMRRRGVVLPVKGIRRRTDKTKEQRILSLVPRFEWGRVSMKEGLLDLLDELAKFPRSRHDDLLDALASIEEIAIQPPKEHRDYEPRSPNDNGYESWYIQQLGEQNS